VTGWPLLAEPTSGVRCGEHDRSHVVAHYDVLLRAEGFTAGHPAELVLRVGDTPTSKPLRTWLAEHPQVLIDPHATWHDPTRRA
jgi:2-succinyl-5-enolpyruvyl-6-hydroxy-3-cyclohexene-1-carboxylate synthase